MLKYHLTPADVYLHREVVPTTACPGDSFPTAEVRSYLARQFLGSNAAVFHCPSDRDPVPQRIETADYDLPNSARVSYDFYTVFWQPEFGPLVGRLRGAAPLAWDLDGGSKKVEPDQNHGVGGGNVVFADGHGEWQVNTAWDGASWPNPAAQSTL